MSYMQFGWGATLKNQRMDVKCQKMKMAALFGRKLIIGAKIMLLSAL